MSRWKRQVLLQVAAATALAVLAVVARAADAGPVSLKGTQTVVNEQKGSFEMHGSLLGDWQTLSYVPRYQSDTQLVATGRERFTGCLDSNRNGACDTGEAAGTLAFTYTWWARFKDKAPVSGACVHPIIGGTKGFAKARGVVFMKDTLVGKVLRTTYTGTLDLGSARALSSSESSSPC
jgi:hypothetical protein